MQDLIDFISNLFLSFWNTLKAIISQILGWLFGLVLDVLRFFMDLLQDIGLWVWDGLLTVLDWIMQTITIPDSLQTFTLQSLFNGVGGDLMGLFGYIGIPEALAMILGAFTVRLLRDIVRR